MSYTSIINNVYANKGTLDRHREGAVSSKEGHRLAQTHASPCPNNYCVKGHV